MLADLNKTMSVALEVLDKNAVLSGITDLKAQIMAENLLNGQEIFPCPNMSVICI